MDNTGSFAGNLHRRWHSKLQVCPAESRGGAPVWVRSWNTVTSATSNCGTIHSIFLLTFSLLCSYALYDAHYISGSNEPLRRYDHSKLSKIAACRQFGFDVTENNTIRSADPENPTLEPNMKCIGIPVAEIWPFAYLGGIWNPHFGGGRSYKVSDGTIRKRGVGFL